MSHPRSGLTVVMDMLGSCVMSGLYCMAHGAVSGQASDTQVTKNYVQVLIDDINHRIGTLPASGYKVSHGG